jgi:hypothetical protein
VDGGAEHGLREVDRRQLDRLFASRKRVAGQRFGELRDGADIAGDELLRRLLRLPRDEQLADALSDALVGVQAAVG